MVNEKSSAVGVNIQEKATVIWNIANALFGYFKPHEYGLVILPMTVGQAVSRLPAAHPRCGDRAI